MRFSMMMLAVLFSLSLGLNQAEAKVSQGDKFPELELKTLEGKSFKPESLKGKIVLVDFWAHWCEPCKISFPFLAEVAKKYKGKVVVVGVNVDSEIKDAKEFLATNPLPGVSVLSDPKTKFVEKVGVSVMPTSFLLDKNGKVTMVHQGFRSGDQATVEKEIAKLLKEK